MSTAEVSQPGSTTPSFFVRQNSLMLLAICFLGWGFLRALNDIVVAAHQVQQPSRDTTAMLIHVSFFAAYLIFPTLASAFIARFGLGRGLAVSSGLMGISALLCSIGLRSTPEFPYLVSLFGLAAGIAILQTAGNPAATLLGPASSGAQRLLVVQSAMSFGAAIAPFCVAAGHPLMKLDPAVMLAGSRGIYVVIGALLTTLALVFLAASKTDSVLRNTVAAVETPHQSTNSSTKFAAIAVFLFVGTEATVLTHILQLECPVFFVPVGMRETGLKGAEDGTRKEAYT